MTVSFVFVCILQLQKISCVNWLKNNSNYFPHAKITYLYQTHHVFIDLHVMLIETRPLQKNKKKRGIGRSTILMENKLDSRK